jgi:extracellular elastinolytic metalloproteinase
MSQDVDRRDDPPSRLTPQREAQLQARAAELEAACPGLHVRIERFNARTGNPHRVVLSGTQPERGRFVERVLEGARIIAPVIGLAPTQPPEFVAGSTAAQTSSGAAAVNLQQQYKGIPIFGAQTTVRFLPDGAVAEVVGTTVTVAEDLPVAAAVRAEDAVRRALEHITQPRPGEPPQIDPFGQPVQPLPVSLANFTPTVVSTFSALPTQPTVFTPGPFEELKARLSWFPLSTGLRLGWEIFVQLPQTNRQLHTVVDAQSDEILYSKSTP